MVAMIHRKNQPDLATDQRGKQKIEEFSYTWRPVGTYGLKYSDFRKVIPQKSDDFGAIFSQKSFVCELHWTFFGEKKVDLITCT